MESYYLLPVDKEITFMNIRKKNIIKEFLQVISSTFWSHVGYFLTDGTVNFLLLIWWMNM